MKQFHCLKNEKRCTSYLCTSIIHPIWLTLPFPLHRGFRSLFHCSLGKPNYWLQAPSWNFTLDKISMSIANTNNLFTSAAHI